MSRNAAPLSTVNPNALDSEETILQLNEANAETLKREASTEKINALRVVLFRKFSYALIRENADNSMELSALLAVMAPFYRAFKIKRLSEKERDTLRGLLRPDFATITF